MMAEKQKGKNGTGIAVLLLLTIASIACGGFLGISVLAPSDAGTTAMSNEAPVASTEDGEPSSQGSTEKGIPDLSSGDFMLKPFPTIITNLAEPKSSWIRLEGQFLVKKETPDVDTVVLRTGQGVLTYLRTVKLSQIEGASAFLFLRDDLNDLVLTLSDGQIREVLIQSFVIE